MRKYLLGASSIILIILVWAIYAAYINNIYVLPGPLKVFKTLFDILFDSQTYLILVASFLRLTIALVISFVFGLILGLLSGNYPFLDEFLHPIVSTLRSIPIASIIVIVLILIGHEASLYIITFLMIFPICYEASMQGVKHIDKSLKHAISLETSSKLTIITKIQFPLALPYIKTSIIQSIGLGFKVIVMAEFIAQSSIGIGRELYKGSISINYDRVFAWTIIIIFIVILIEKIFKKNTAYDIHS